MLWNVQCFPETGFVNGCKKTSAKPQFLSAQNNALRGQADVNTWIFGSRGIIEDDDIGGRLFIWGSGLPSLGDNLPNAALRTPEEVLADLESRYTSKAVG